MVRSTHTALGGSLAIAVLVLGACGGGTPSAAPAASSAATTAATAQTSPSAAVAGPSSSAAPSAAARPAGSVAPTVQGTHNGRIAFGVRAADGSANIFSVLPDGTDQLQLTTGTTNHLCAAFAADGDRIAYCADESGAFEIWTMQPDGTDPTQLTHLGGRALFPDFSRDGSTIAFGGVQGDDPNTEIYTVDAGTGGGLTALTSCAGKPLGCSNDFPAWSPDDQSIIFIHTDDFDANDNAVNAQVWRMHADGTDAHAITTGAAPKDQLPEWSPDGTHIVYASGKGPNEGIWVMRADGSKPQQLSGCRPGDPTPCAGGDDGGPVWSPDGKQIAFLRSFQDVGSDDRPIFVMNADGSDQHRLNDGPILAAVPAWQPRATAGGG
jgi:Tol biopolymer transport system component